MELQHLLLYSYLITLMNLQHQLPVLPPKSRHVSPTDLLTLEDELQRILLAGINIDEYVTGVVLALLGHEDDSGKFQVQDVCCAGIPMAPKTKVNTPEKRYVILTRI